MFKGQCEDAVAAQHVVEDCCGEAGNWEVAGVYLCRGAIQKPQAETEHREEDVSVVSVVVCTHWS